MVFCMNLSIMRSGDLSIDVYDVPNITYKETLKICVVTESKHKSLVLL